MNGIDYGNGLEPLHAVNCERCGNAYDLITERHCQNPVCVANPAADPNAIRLSRERHERMVAEDAERKRIADIRRRAMRQE